jgi:hypothetical protein
MLKDGGTDSHLDPNTRVPEICEVPNVVYFVSYI